MMNLFDLDSPINKARMMGLSIPGLAQRFAAASAQANSLPSAPAPGGPVKGPGLLDNFFPAPGGMVEAGLLTEEDLKNAQTQGLFGLGASLLADSGPKTADQAIRPMQSVGRAVQNAQGAHQGALQSSMGLRAGAMDFEGKKMALATAKSLAEGRKAVVAKYPMPQGGAPNAMVSWIDTVLPHFIELNDEETVRSLTEIRKSIGGQQSKEPGDWVTVPGPDGKPMRRHVTASEAGTGIREYEKPNVSQAQPRLVPVINPSTGKPELAEYDPQTRKFRYTGQKPTSTGAGSEAERKAQAIYELSAPHVGLLDQADAPNRIEQLAASGKLNEFLNENRQLFDISGRQLADAYLRLTTGAAYNKEELEQAIILMTPRPGDTPKTIQLKRANRQRLVNALKAAAGRAYSEVDMNVGVELGDGGPSLDNLWDGAGE
jgi:hypothetical protein